jgi:CheY-like chemotaxis protein
LLDDFIAAHETRSGVRRTPTASPSPFGEPRHLRVLLVDADRIGRTAFARGLAREKCLVTIAASLEELGEIVRTGEPVDAVLLDGQHPARLLLLEMIVDRFPGAAIVVRSSAEDATRALLHSLGVTRFEVVPAGGLPDALVAAVWRVATG